MNTFVNILGWITFIIGGAYFFGGIAAATYLHIVKGGLEKLAAANIFLFVTAAAWVVFALWLSPVSININ